MKQQNTHCVNQESVRLQENMKSLFRFALEMKYLSLRQIEKKFFAGKAAHNEMTSLVQKGYFRVKDRDLKFGSVFIPTAKAKEVLGSIDPLLPQAMQSVFAPRVNHDQKLTDLRIRFEELGFIQKWTSERMLSLIPEIKTLLLDEPDAVCRKKDGNGYFLELEITQKTKAQYEFRINKYLEALVNEDIQKEKIEGVIFICTDEKVQKFIKALIPESEKRISVLPYDRYFKKESADQEGRKWTKKHSVPQLQANPDELRASGPSYPNRAKHNSSLVKKVTYAKK